MGKLKKIKTHPNFSQQQLQNPRPTAPSLHPLLPSCAPTSYYFSPMLLSSENHPEARHSPGWLTPKQSPCSSHACNNLSLLKEPRLLEGSTLTPPPPPLLTLYASEASGLFPLQRCTTQLHVLSLQPPRPSLATVVQTAPWYLPTDLPLSCLPTAPIQTCRCSHLMCVTHTEDLMRREKNKR